MRLGRSVNKVLVGALALSLAIHLVALFGTPRFALGWGEAAPPPAPLVATFVPPPASPPPAASPPAAVPPAAASAPRKPQPRPRPRSAAPVAVPPAQLVASTLFDAPSPDGEPADDAAVPAENPPPTAAVEVAEPPVSAPEPIADQAAPAAYPVRRARLVYDLYYLTSLAANNPTKVGEVTHRWSQDGRRYEVESVAEAIGFLSLVFNGKFVQRSTGELRPDGLHPDEYTLDRGRGDRAEVARFDWPEAKLVLAWKDRSQTVPLPAAAQDPLSLMHQLYFLRSVPESGTIAVATSRKLYRSSFELAGGETLVTALGTVRTLRFRREEPNGAATELWADLDRSLLPARVRAIDRKGNVVDQVIREVELEPAAPNAAARPDGN
jgi:hypothetical protein